MLSSARSHRGKRSTVSFGESTTRRRDRGIWTRLAQRVTELIVLLRGWSGYFNQGRVIRAYRVIHRYTERRLRRWLSRRQGKRGTGYRQYPDAYLYETLGRYRLPDSRAAVARAKA